ncbi:putative conserved membrane protein [Mycolicibacterium phlei]|jgi:hypothetical protein|uniref:Membrane protein n=1 Tax=Mycolicibacterium phlei DSM 43239 = CCUG 21000 TaxID=1226750 RepID=A0A5N5UYZ8_MYCPH|nr:hypothetical protein [Mycolicibacterium phlei]VEG12065.1 putative conserved membrane protein [Mycobacteroides chelonae]AMO63976.1 hypothetical protein MPHLCCUG_05193 [Mycolicibacterium phlei]EID09322.1 hypothetical protein MPHLEI_25271 [Mycolicibacterium phlei RIVM601174]KAB7754638.1 membrane protein [Mycolicibacterium phlei DSM 43239 = CCUG 21000]KXW65283.1 membrane protein [Mycolicibacterium phlei DSM 43239 = CCUG 21000]
MQIAAVLCLCAAVATAALGLWLLTRPRSGDHVREVLRSVAPTQLAAAAMLAAGGAVALAVDTGTGVVLLAICVLGAVGTVAAGCWQSATAVARQEAARRKAGAGTGGCGNACATCTLSCDR